jgi:Helicase associated domain
MTSSNSDVSKLEGSILQYFQWRTAALTQQDETTANGGEDDSLTKERYNKIVEVLSETTGPTEALDAIPRVYSLWTQGLLPDDHNDDDEELEDADIPKPFEIMARRAVKEIVELREKVSSLADKLAKTESKLAQKQVELKDIVHSKLAQVKKMKQMEGELYMLRAKNTEMQQLNLRVRKEAELKRKREEELENSPWEKHFQELVRFHKQHGHCRVTQTMDKSLYIWVAKNRRFYREKNKILTEERINRLNALKFIWKVPSGVPTFDQRIEECRAFKAKYGHLRVPNPKDKHLDGTDPTEDEISFRYWAQTMRRQYRRKVKEGHFGEMSVTRTKMLEELGFDWMLDAEEDFNSNRDEEMFQHRVNQLRKVKELYGTCNDKACITAVFPDSKKLYEWIKTQRRGYYRLKRGESTWMTPDRMRMLQEVDFDFDPNKRYVEQAEGQVADPAALPATDSQALPTTQDAYPPPANAYPAQDYVMGTTQQANYVPERYRYARQPEPMYM